jgi:uncharacterized protein (DUF2336 family)
MPRIAREIDDALKAVTIARMFFDASGPTASMLDLELWKILKQGSSALRAEMAEQLARVAGGPTRTLRALAHDPNPDVAAPLLQHSAAISNTAIAEMARCKGDKHLEAIAARQSLDEKICGILTRRGSPKVLKTLARNPTALFSTDSRQRLEMRLRHHELANRRADRRVRDTATARRLAASKAGSYTSDNL